MKAKVILLISGLALAACKYPKRVEDKVDSIASIESGPGKIGDERYLVVPGISVGEISLGADMETVGQKLGKPQAGDAAMGKAWGIWYQKDSTAGHPSELAIYSAYRDTSMRVKDVKQIRINSSKFKTQDGFAIGKNFEDTQNKFPGMSKAALYINENKDTVLVYDSKSDGISFEFLKGKSIALTVHPKNVSIVNTYLTLHPEWKVLSGL